MQLLSSFARQPLSTRAFGAGLICSALLVSEAQAAPPTIQTSALQRARQAWDDGEFDQAERGYQDALTQGSMDRASTLECYVHLGAIRAVLGKKTEGLVAFRIALFIDDNFTTPSEAGKKAAALAEAARRQGGRVGVLHISINAPTEVASGEPFAVNVLVDAAQAALVSRFSLHVKDTTTNKVYQYDEPASAVAHFRVPANMTLPRAMLRIQVDALDPHDNQLATSEEHVTVRATPIREGSPALLAQPDPNKEGDKKSGGGFWASPWPWVIGGLALAAGGGTAAYFLLKPPDQVSVGAPTLQSH